MNKNRTTTYETKPAKKNKNYHNYSYDEEQISLRDIKRDFEHKKRKRVDNYLRSKDINALMEYEDD